MSESAPERLLTTPLKIFLVVVLAVVSTAIVARLPSPDLEGAIELLAAIVPASNCWRGAWARDRSARCHRSKRGGWPWAMSCWPTFSAP